MKIVKQCARQFLMIKPVNFFFNKETFATNSFQNPSKYTLSELKKKVQIEFDKSVETLKEEGVLIDVIDPPIMENIPDQIFPNNWFQVLDDGRLILFPMQSFNRRGERLEIIIDHIKSKYEISSTIDLSHLESGNLFLEGTGSMVMDHINKIVYAVRSKRTSEKVLLEYCNIVGYDYILFNANDIDGTPLYHTNILLSIGPGFAVICSELISEEDRESVLKSLTFHKINLIEIEKEQLYEFCANILSVLSFDNETLIIMSNRAKNGFRVDQLEKISLYGKIVSVPVDTIESVGGGGIRCMMAEIFSI